MQKTHFVCCVVACDSKNHRDSTERSGGIVMHQSHFTVTGSNTHGSSRSVTQAGASLCVRGAVAFLVALGAAGYRTHASAQYASTRISTARAEARALYDQRLKACDAALPRPEYEACIRAAGAALDRRGVAANGTKAVESSDGRAKIYVAPGTTPPPGGAGELAPKTVTSRDGRATLLVPSDSTLRSTRTIVP
jgi:hypothetical protein